MCEVNEMTCKSLCLNKFCASAIHHWQLKKILLSLKSAETVQWCALYNVEVILIQMFVGRPDHHFTTACSLAPYDGSGYGEDCCICLFLVSE